MLELDLDAALGFHVFLRFGMCGLLRDGWFVAVAITFLVSLLLVFHGSVVDERTIMKCSEDRRTSSKQFWESSSQASSGFK